MSFSPLSNSNSMPQKDMQRHYSFDRDTEEKHEIIRSLPLEVRWCKGVRFQPKNNLNKSLEILESRVKLLKKWASLSEKNLKGVKEVIDLTSGLREFSLSFKLDLLL